MRTQATKSFASFRAEFVRDPSLRAGRFLGRASEARAAASAVFVLERVDTAKL